MFGIVCVFSFYVGPFEGLFAGISGFCLVYFCFRSFMIWLGYVGFVCCFLCCFVCDLTVPAWDLVCAPVFVFLWFCCFVVLLWCGVSFTGVSAGFWFWGFGSLGLGVG